MILSDKGIREAIRSGVITITPEPKPEQYTSSAVDLTLGVDFRVWDWDRFNVPGAKVELDLGEQRFQKTARAYLIPAECEKDGSFVLPPYSTRPRHLLAVTRERIHLKRESRLAARVEGRSSFARIGLMVHLTAPTIHAGFQGNITLEVINHGPFHLRLVPGVRICQLIFEQLATDPGEIVTEFQGQTKPSGER